MDVVSWVSAGIALVSVATTAVLGYWQQQRLRTMEQRSLMDSYGASLAWAAYDLQTRFFNILRGHAVDEAGEESGYLTSFLTFGNEEEAEYARRSTVFVLAEYLGWVEILRRDVQFLDLGSSVTNRNVMAQISQVSHALSRILPESNALRLFRAEQRAIGELMVHPDGEPRRRRCLGFAEFCARLDRDEAFRGWFQRLLDDVDALADDTGPAVWRLTDIQRQLVRLLDLLDPRAERFPQFREVFDHARVAARARGTVGGGGRAGGGGGGGRGAADGGGADAGGARDAGGGGDAGSGDGSAGGGARGARGTGSGARGARAGADGDADGDGADACGTDGGSGSGSQGAIGS